MMPIDNTPTGVTIEPELVEFPDYNDNIEISADPVPGILNDPTMYFDQVSTTTVSPLLYDYLFSFGKPTKGKEKQTRKKFNAQSLRDAYSQILKTAEVARERRSHHKRVLRQLSEEEFEFQQDYFGTEVESEFEFSDHDDELADSRQLHPFSTLSRPWDQPRAVIGILDKRAPPEFRFNNFVLISLPVFSVASTGSTGKTQTCRNPDEFEQQ